MEFKIDPNAKEWTPTSSKKGIKEVCARENETTFRQTEDTELMNLPYNTLLDYIGDTDSCKYILKGIFALHIG